MLLLYLATNNRQKCRMEDGNLAIEAAELSEVF
jgi:hypothetical protein